MHAVGKAHRLCYRETVSYLLHNPNTTKSYKNYLQNTQHMVLRNRPTLSIGTERLACLNSPLAYSWGPSPSTRQVPGSSPGPGGRAARAFFSTLPSFLHQPCKSVRVKGFAVILTPSFYDMNQ